jgi:Domain of unknown function (DUF4351)
VDKQFGFVFTERVDTAKVGDMNDYDKAGRFLAKHASEDFCRWWLGNPKANFHAWIDARRVALPNQGDLNNDLVAALSGDKGLEGFCVELEAEARADSLTRELAYVTRVWTEPGDKQSLPLVCVSGVILDLTGRSPARELTLQSAIVPGCSLELKVLRRHLAAEDAASLVARVTAGKLSVWLLGWIPLMRGGGESAIIMNWKLQVESRLVDERDRANLGSIALVFATLAGCRPAWERGLKGWNMQTSPYLDEIRAQGREEGRAEGARALVLRLGQQKFGRAPAKKQQKQLESIADLAELEALAERLRDSDSWADLLA